MQDTEQLLTYADVEQWLGIARGTLYSWVHRRQIPFCRLGPRVVRFSRVRLETWLAEQTVQPTAPDERDDGADDSDAIANIAPRVLK